MNKAVGVESMHNSAGADMSTADATKPARAGLVLVIALAGVAAHAETTGADMLYRLSDHVLTDGALLDGRWTSPTLSMRLEAATGLAPRHELRVLSTAQPDASSLLAALSRNGLGSAPMHGYSVSPVRATYRYTVLERPEWALKLGLSANVGDGLGSSLRAGLIGGEPAFGSLPLLHVAGERHWSKRWSMSFAFDGLMTGAGRTMDLGVRVDYSLARGMTVYGGYQMIEAAGEAEPYYGNGVINRANVGVRMRF